MKRFFAALLSFALCLALLLFIRSEPDEPILHVALKGAGEQDVAYVYETVYTSGKSRACDAFTPDACVFYTADYADFDTSALRSHRVNTLVATTLYDSVGNVVEPNETMIAMMHAAADQIDHAIFDFQIIVVNGQRYLLSSTSTGGTRAPCTSTTAESSASSRSGTTCACCRSVSYEKSGCLDRDSRFSFFTCFSPSCTGPVPRQIRRSSPPSGRCRC